MRLLLKSQGVNPVPIILVAILNLIMLCSSFGVFVCPVDSVNISINMSTTVNNTPPWINYIGLSPDESSVDGTQINAVSGGNKTITITAQVSDKNNAADINPMTKYGM